MHDCRKIEERLVDQVFDELSADRRIQTLDEVESCPHCRAQIQAYTMALSTFDEATKLMAPGEDYWDRYEARLRAKLVADARANRSWRFAEVVRGFLRQPARGFSLAALVLLALVSLYVLKPTASLPGARPQQIAGANLVNSLPFSKKAKKPEEIVRPPTIPRTGQGAQSRADLRQKLKVERREIARAMKSERQGQKQNSIEPAVSGAQTSVLASAVDVETIRHFEKTQMLLRAFRNLRPDESAVVEVADEKQRSRALLFQNILRRREAEAKGLLPVERVLSDVEPLLIDIANLPDRATPDEIRAVRERVQRKAMIATLQVYLSKPAVVSAITE